MQEPIKRLPVHYITAVSGVFRIRSDFKHFDAKVPDDYDWPTGEKPKIYRRSLLSLISFKHSDRRILMDMIRKYKDQNRIEYVMFDSGGFQVFRRPEYSLERLFRENQILYKQYDFADAYVLPDLPAHPTESLQVMEDKAQQTIDASTRFFDLMPDHLKERAMPVFHTRKQQHLEEQLDRYKHILDASGIACYAIPGLNKRLGRKHMKRLKYLMELRPELKVHLLGIASPSAVWCMYNLGLTTYDAISPVTAGANGQVFFGNKNVIYSEKKEDSVSIDELEQRKRDTNHRCPFCDDLDRLKWDYHYRMVHNLIVLDELNHYLTTMTMDKFAAQYPQMGEWLAEALGLADQQTLF